MWPGIEADLIPAQPAGPEAAKTISKRKGTKVWLAGELIIRCEHQGLQCLPSQLFSKGTLRKLILTGNSLAHLPDEIQQLKELRELRIGHNHLRWLPDAVCSLQHLQQLDVQHNQLDAVPSGLCRLLHLEMLNLDGNPLSGTAGSGGPPLCTLWPAAPCFTPPVTGDQNASGQQSPGSTGREAAANAVHRLKQGTDTVLQHLLQQQEPLVQIEVKQAKLRLLQQSSLKRISKLVTIADLDSLAACLNIATSTGLGEKCISHIQIAQAATSKLQQATAQVQTVRKQQADVEASSVDDSAFRAAHLQLTAAIKEFEAICKPGRPSGPIYHQAHSEWRSLQRQQMERGWRCSSPSSPVSANHQGHYSGSLDVISQGVSDEASSSIPHRRFLTSAERRRQQLQAAGAETYDQWCVKKQEAEQQERSYWQVGVSKHCHDRASASWRRHVTTLLMFKNLAKALRGHLADLGILLLKCAQETLFTADYRLCWHLCISITTACSAAQWEDVTNWLLTACTQKVAQQEVQCKVSRIQECAVRSLENCSREKAWPSKVVEAYPAGTFSMTPELLKSIRRQYQRPPAVNQ